MIRIKKADSPVAFEDWKSRKKLREEDFRLKKNPFKPKEARETFSKLKKYGNEEYLLVQESLSTESHGLCCYCQMEIVIKKNFSIEHLVPIDVDPCLMFNYDNMMASCSGGGKDSGDEPSDMGLEPFPKYCNLSRGSQPLAIHPMMEGCEMYFEYEIKKDTIDIKGKSQVAKDVIKFLNLNTPKFTKARYEAMKGYLIDEGELIEDREMEMMKVKVRESPVSFAGVLLYLLENKAKIQYLY